jgi:hypothetical protein
VVSILAFVYGLSYELSVDTAPRHHPVRLTLSLVEAERYSVQRPKQVERIGVTMTRRNNTPQSFVH